MRRETIYLEQKCGDNALDLPGLMFVSAFFRDRVKFIEEQDTPAGSHKLKCVI